MAQPPAQGGVDFSVCPLLGMPVFMRLHSFSAPAQTFLAPIHSFFVPSFFPARHRSYGATVPRVQLLQEINVKPSERLAAQIAELEKRLAAAKKIEADQLKKSRTERLLREAERAGWLAISDGDFEAMLGRLRGAAGGKNG